MPEITKNAPASPPRTFQFGWLLLAVLVIFVYFFGLTLPLLGPDESRYAQVAREMFERGDWVTPTLGGFHWFEKPALLYWLQITFYHIFGVTEFSARLGSALFGLGTIASLWVLGKNYGTTASYEANGSSYYHSQFPNYLALTAASSLGILVFSRGASFDIIVTFPMTAALVSFFIFDRSPEGNWRKRYLPLALFYVFIGVSLLAKGLIGILFPFAIVACYHVLSWRWPNRTFLASLIWGTLLVSVVAALWYLPMYQRNGWEFIDEFIIQHHFMRFSSNKYQHPQPFFFFLWVLPLMTFPWFPFFFASLWRIARGMLRRTPAFERPDISSPLLLFASSWMVVPLVFFSISGSKLPGYILPAVPAAIILAALVVLELVERSSKWRTAILTTAVLTLVGVLALLIFAVPKFADSDSVRSLMAAANERGLTHERVFMVYTLSHNAEFYAPGRLLRDETGKQRTFYRVDDLLPYLAAEPAGTALALVPIEHTKVLFADSRISTEILKDNTELAVARISVK